MTAFGLLRVTPMGKDDVTADVAAAIEALEESDVSYETTPMATTIEAENAAELFRACAAAHEAVDAAEVHTLLQVDDKREKTMAAADKVDAVADELGRDPASVERNDTADRNDGN